MTPDGATTVERLVKDDPVLSSNQHDHLGRVVVRHVLATSQTTAPIWHLHVGGQVIRASGEHPFFIWGRGWTTLRDLKVGDWLRGHDGRWIMVEDLCDAGVIEEVYNATIDEDHTYFVGRPSWGFAVWAHNAEISCGMTAEEARQNGLNPKTKQQAGVVRPDRHHIFPQNEADKAWFRARGINVDDFTVELSAGEHSAVETMGWREKIMAALKNREAALGRALTPDEIKEIGRQMAARFKIGHLPWIPYQD